jgi:hypothetical protein
MGEASRCSNNRTQNYIRKPLQAEDIDVNTRYKSSRHELVRRSDVHIIIDIIYIFHYVFTTRKHMEL